MSAYLSDVDVIDSNVCPVWHTFSPSLLTITPSPKKKKPLSTPPVSVTSRHDVMDVPQNSSTITVEVFPYKEKWYRCSQFVPLTYYRRLLARLTFERLEHFLSIAGHPPYLDHSVGSPTSLVRSSPGWRRSHPLIGINQTPNRVTDLDWRGKCRGRCLSIRQKRVVSFPGLYDPLYSNIQHLK